MEIMKKIFTILLAISYLLVAYGRLIYTPPIFVSIHIGGQEKYIPNSSSSSNKYFILLRRHLPLEQKVEIEKIIPAIVADWGGHKLNENENLYAIEVNQSYNHNSAQSLNNKAPPVIS
jgi:hypothetical protein